MKKILLFACLSIIYTTTFALANPASVKCEQDGGKLSIVKDSSGSENGVCTFSNGNTCDEWAYFRGECSSVSNEIKACTREYMPVCAEVQVQCIKAPCDPIKETFSNKCEMGNNKNAKFLYDGACESKDSTGVLSIIEKPIACTMDYTPVCGQPKMPDCKEGSMCIQVMPEPLTYGNKCTLDADKATYLYDGECKVSFPIYGNDDNSLENISEVKISKETNLYILDIAYPLTGDKKIDKKINLYVKNTLKEFSKNIGNVKVSSDWKNEISIVGSYSINSGITSYELTIYQFTGGAHGSTYVKTFNFSKKGTEIILKNKKFLNKVSSYSTKYFLKNLESADKDWIKSGLEAKFENFSNWKIEKDNSGYKIIFIFQQYQIAPYVEGIKTIGINVKDLK